MPEHPRETLIRLTGRIMAPEVDYLDLKKAIEKLFRLFCDLASLQADADEIRQHQHLASGKAIGTLWAGMCLNELLRTRCFLLGVHRALQALTERSPDQPLRLAYAGTGPFATLVLPLLGFWTPGQVQVTLMDINEASLACLRRVVAALEADAWISEIICCDAASYQFEEAQRPHLIVSETMLHALKNEPQVSIALNMVPQLLPGGVFVPQNVVVDAGLFHHKQWFNNLSELAPTRACVQRLGTAFALNTRDMPVLEERAGSQAWFPSAVITVPPRRDPGFDELQLFTEIQVFEDIWLRDWECSLNLPEPVLRSLPDGAIDVQFRYEVSARPGLRWTVAGA